MTTLLAFLALTLAGGGVGYATLKRQRLRRVHQGLVRRFSHRFPSIPGEIPDDAFALRSPPGPSGHIAIEEAGLIVRLDQEATPTLRHVPWAEIHHVDTAGGGVFRVHISGVGDLAVPMAAGRKIWDGTLAARSAPRHPQRQPVGV